MRTRSARRLELQIRRGLRTIQELPLKPATQVIVFDSSPASLQSCYQWLQVEAICGLLANKSRPKNS